MGIGGVYPDPYQGIVVTVTLVVLAAEAGEAAVTTSTTPVRARRPAR
ncbi:MAG: hypothetical protein H0T70_03120 [Acidimicrobiia bacterium]|nr:hypothetical protein [Acidimicrobiia bacterium]